MSPATLAERIRVETQILAYSREALVLALNASIEIASGEDWCERVRFLTESFERHVRRLYRIKWEVDDQSLILQSEQPGLIDELVILEAEQRELSFEIRSLTHESRELASDNLNNLRAFRQRMIGFIERFDDVRLREMKLWLDAYDLDIGGEG
jgi:hypothetical protein